MPAYLVTPLDGIPPMLIPGTPGYSFGTAPVAGPTVRMQVTNVALTTNVATLTVQMVEGNIPAVGSLISVRGTKTASGAFNVSNVALASVSITASTGAGTVTFALTHANVASTPDAGQAAVPVPVTLETLPGSATAGLQFSVQSGPNAVNNQRGITWFTQYSGSPSTVTANLQGADIDQDSAYTTLDSSTVATGESRSLANVNYQFLRVQMASTGGTSPKCAAGIMVR